MLNAQPVPGLPRRDRFLVCTCILLATVLSWAYLLHLHREMSSAMEHDRMMKEMGMTMDMPWSRADVFFTFAMWVVMMIGMMVPSAAPLLLLFAGARAKSGGRGAMPSVLIFGLGYLAVWTGFSALATLAQWGLHQATLLSMTGTASSPAVGGVILVIAGLYQLTPWKGECLTHCRSPLGFLMTNWRDGNLGVLQMGFRHGAFCLGCCWALMCVLFVVGVMNLVWVAALTVFVLIEKVGPAGKAVSRVSGGVMAGLGVLMIAGIV